jgi:single-stranded-DNA-specific exonuclease
MPDAPAPPDSLYARARRMLEQDVTVVAPHTDADGLAAGAIALRARGESAADALLFGRGTNPFTHPELLPRGGSVPAVLDQGVRSLGRPALIVDHHVPEAPPPPPPPPPPRKDQIVITGHDEPNVSTSILMRRIVPEAPAWLAAVGAAGDYGDAGLARPECAGAGGVVEKSHVKKLVPLINAPRRGPDLDAVRAALAILVESPDARAALADPRVAVLEASRAATKAAFDAVVRTPPKFFGPVAVLRFRSDYQVHPLVAQTWSRRLAPRIVMAANEDYLPGRINFACRVAGAETNIRERLRAALPEGLTGGHEFGHGHAQATGGSLPPALFDLLLERLAKTPSA